MTKPKFDIFISHAKADKPVAESVAYALGAQGLQVWTDGQIRVGEPWVEITENALQEAKTYLVLLSPTSLQSPWTHFEMGVAASRAAHSEDVRLIPVLLKGAQWGDVPPPLRDRAGIDANNMTADELANQLKSALSCS